MRPLASLVVLAGFCVAAVNAQQAEKVVAVHEEPRHRLVFDSPGTRILDVQIPPGDTTLFHTHSDPILYVTMSTSQTRSQTLGGEWSGGDPSQRPAPAPAAPIRRGRLMSTTSYAERPLTHRVSNVGQSLFRLIGITNASPGDPGADPGVGFAGAPELTNRWFRGYRAVLDPTPLEHRHTNPVAVVLIAGRTRLTGSPTTVLETPGAFAWIEANTAHTLQAAAEDTEIVEVEVRRTR